MWTKEYLQKDQREFYEKFSWYWNAYDTFSDQVKKIIKLYKDNPEKAFNSPPPYLGFSLTYRCNMKCPMCFQDRTKYKDDMSLERYNRIQSEIKKAGNKPWVTLWGGEPTLHKEFVKIYNGFIDPCSLVVVCTNGTQFQKFPEIFENPLAQSLWVVSVDGLEATHDVVRGKGNFKKTIDNLKTAIKIRDKNNTKHMFAAEVTLLKDNIDEIVDVTKLLFDTGLDWVILNHLWFLSPQAVDAYKEELRNFKEFQCNPLENRAEGFILSENDLVNPLELFTAVNEAKSLYGNDSLVFEMPLLNSSEKTTEYYNFNKQWKPKGFSCYKNLVKFDFSTIGEAVVCKQFPDLSYGNLKEKGVYDIWYSEERKMAVNKLIDCQGLSICASCPDKALSDPYN